MQAINSQQTAIDELGKAVDYILTNDSVKRSVLALWVAWKNAVTAGTETRTFVECVTQSATIFDELSENLIDCTQFSLPQNNLIDDLLGGATISRVFLFLTRTGHQVKSAVKRLRDARTAKIPFATSCGIVAKLAEAA